MSCRVAMFLMSLMKSGILPGVLLNGIILDVIISFGIFFFTKISFIIDLKYLITLFDAFFKIIDDKRSNPGASTLYIFSHTFLIYASVTGSMNSIIKYSFSFSHIITLLILLL